MRELLLHIGSHKTGTTTIQIGMAEHREALVQQGVDYLPHDGPPLLHRYLGPTTPWNVAEGGFCVTDPDGLERVFSEAVCDKAIASSENFSFFFERDAIEQVKKLAARHFDKTRILVYLRRQDSHIVSHHQEGSKHNRRAEEQIFGYSTSSIPWDSLYLDKYLDYNKRIGMWMDVFGEENVTVRVFDRETLKNGDVWADFLDVTGIASDGIETAREQNVSQGLTKTKVGHLMNEAHIHPELHSFILRFLPDDARQVPARADAIRFYERYTESNKALANRMGIGGDLFDQSFSRYPEVAAENWNNESADLAIASLLRAMSVLCGPLDADTLRDAAFVARKDGRKEIARKLAEGAAHLRPHGPAIQKLLSELKS